MTPGKPAVYWAIEADFDFGRRIIGIGWFGWQRPEWCGATTATFETRALARKYKKQIQNLKTRVVRVELRELPIAKERA